MIHPRYRAAHVLNLRSDTHQLEFFLDFNCPFSAKMFIKLQDEIIPEMKKRDIYGNYSISFINVVQPWHGFQSSVLHDVSFAVGRICNAETFWNVCRVFFDHITDFYDSNIADTTRTELTDKIISLCEGVVEAEDLKQVKLLLVPVLPNKETGEASNAGNGVIVDNKYFARYHRTMGIHMTPSVVANGIYLNAIESSTPTETIVDMFEKL